MGDDRLARGNEHVRVGDVGRTLHGDRRAVLADQAVRVDGRLDAEVRRPRRIEAAGLDYPQ